MPKLNVTHLVGRIQERIEQLERGDALETRDINALLNKEQLQALKDAWTTLHLFKPTPRHLSIGVNLFKLTEPLLSNQLQLASTAYSKYRFHPACTTLQIHTKGCHLYPTASANQAR